jgi:hypothetical protein
MMVSIHGKITEEKWLNNQNGAVALPQILETARLVIREDITASKNCDPETMNILSVLVSVETIEKDILPHFIQECALTETDLKDERFGYRLREVWFRAYYNTITEKIKILEQSYETTDLMTKQEKLKVIHKLATASYVILDTIQRRAFEHFRENIDVYSFLWMMDDFGLPCNVIVVDATNHEMFKPVGILDDEKPCVLLLYHPVEKHFESLGKLMEIDGVKSVSRLFEMDDDVVNFLIKNWVF